MENALQWLECRKTEEYRYFVEHARAELSTRIQNAKYDIIVTYAELGEQVYQTSFYQKFAKGNTKVLQEIFSDIGISKTDGYAAIKLYEKHIKDKFTDVKEAIERIALENPKTQTWTGIKNFLLPTHKEELELCPTCRRPWRPKSNK